MRNYDNRTPGKARADMIKRMLGYSSLTSDDDLFRIDALVDNTDSFEGHKGRPGKVGGSLPANATSSKEKNSKSFTKLHNPNSFTEVKNLKSFKDCGPIEYRSLEVKHKKVDIPEFIKAFLAAKESCNENIRWRVDTHSPEELEGVATFETDGGSTFGVAEDGDIISVCKNYKSSDRGKWLLQMAVEEGGDRLDAFGKDLFNFYTSNGFEPVCSLPFNEDINIEGWKPEYNTEDNPNDVIFYKFTGHKYNIDYMDFIKHGKRFSKDQYNEAKEYRNDIIKKEKSK